MLSCWKPEFCPIRGEGDAESCHSRSNALSPLLCQGPQKVQRASRRQLGVRRQAEAHLPQAQPRKAEQVWKCKVESIFFRT